MDVEELDLDEVMPDPDAEDDGGEDDGEVEETVDRKKLNKQIAALNFKINHPEKFGRPQWQVTERMELDRKLLELEALRGPKQEKASTKPRPEKRGPAYQLAERRGMMRSTLERDEAGEPIVPELKALMTHATKFGSDQVVETAIELGYGHDSAVRLMDHCDRAEAAAYRKDRPKAPPLRFGDSEQRVRVLMGTQAA